MSDPAEAPVETQVPEVSEHDTIRARILFILYHYPTLSPSMLQASLGIKPTDWKPILEELIEEGNIERTSVSAYSPTGRSHMLTKLSLALPAHIEPTSEELQD